MRATALAASLSPSALFAEGAPETFWMQLLRVAVERGRRFGGLVSVDTPVAGDELPSARR